MTNKFVRDWYDIDWRKNHSLVAQLQHYIVVAYIEKDLGRVKQLQQNLVNSFAARALAVRAVATINKGKNTSGVDKVAKLTPEQRIELINSLLDHKNVEPKPVRRVWLSKDGKPVRADRSNARPLGIPCMYDRAAQALWAMALNPIAEHRGDRHSYGYRPHRSAQDAMTALYLFLSTRHRPCWILEADIKGFFDNITHEWIMLNIPMDKTVLKGWLKAGYIDRNTMFETKSGVPQGGPISPIIANMVLDGLSDHVEGVVNSYAYDKVRELKVRTIRYADDFVILCHRRDILESVIRPTVEEFLKIRGLWLSPQKTLLTYLRDGFDFLGFNFRIYPRKKHPTGYGLLIKPSPKKVQIFRDKIKGLFRTMRQSSAYKLILRMNPLLRGWSNYYKTVVSKKIFTNLDYHIWHRCLKWAKSKHRGLGVKKVMKLYYRPSGKRKWVFFGTDGPNELEILRMANVQIKRHTLVKDLNPFLLDNAEYFASRKHRANLSQWDKQRLALLKKCKSVCAVCNQHIDIGEALEMHHIVPKKAGGSNKTKNLVALHRECHRQVTYTKDPLLIARFVSLGILKE